MAGPRKKLSVEEQMKLTAKNLGNVAYVSEKVKGTPSGTKKDSGTKKKQTAVTTAGKQIFDARAAIARENILKRNLPAFKESQIEESIKMLSGIKGPVQNNLPIVGMENGDIMIDAPRNAIIKAVKNADAADRYRKYIEEQKAKNPYSVMDFGELNTELEKVNEEFASGRISYEDFYDKKYRIDLYRIENADKDTLKNMVAEYEENQRYYDKNPRGMKMLGKVYANREENKELLNFAKDRLYRIEADEKDAEINRSWTEKYSGDGVYRKKDNETEISEAYLLNKYHSGEYDEKEVEARRFLEASPLWTELTEDEVKLFNNIHNENPEEAYKFLEEKKTVLEIRKALKKQEEASQYGEKHPYIGGLKSILKNITSAPAEAIDNVLIDPVFEGKVNTYDSTGMEVREAQGLRAGGSKYMAEKHGRGAMFAYDTGMSFVENMAVILLTKGIGGAAGAGEKAISNTAGAIMSMNAASNQMISIADRGGSSSEILLGGVAAGAAEFIFERFSIEKLLSSDSGKLVFNMLKQSGIEGSEEFMTEVANIITDTAIMGEKSENAILRRELIMQGYTAEEAAKKVFLSNLDQVLQAAASGAASGGMMSMTMSGLNAIGESDRKRTIERIIAKDASLVNIVKTIGNIEGRNPEYYNSQEAIDTARAVLKMANDTATQADYALIERSAGARAVVLASNGNNAWQSLKAEADKRVRSAEYGMRSDTSETNGVKYRYAGKTKSGIKKYVTDFSADMDTKTREKVFKERIASIFNLGAVKLNTDTKKIQVEGDSLSAQKNLYGDEIASEKERQAKINSLYDIAEILSDSKFAGKGIEPSFKDDTKKPKNLAHKDVKYWYKFKNTISMDGVIYDVVFNIRDKGKQQYQYLIEFHEKNGDNSNQPYGSKNLRRTLDELSPTDSITEENPTVNSKNMRDSKIYSQGKRVSFEKGERVGGNVVYNEESRKFAKKNREGYKVIQRMAKDLGMKVKFVKGLVDGDGNVLDGVITSEGIFINTEAENPTRWAATHEFSHRMKQTGGKAWQRYQDYVIAHLVATGQYSAKYESKKGIYAENEIDEEIAADYIGEMFSDVKELAEFIRESRGLAFSVRNMWYKVLDKLGLLDEKKKAQRMWASAYREAMKNSDVKYEGENKLSIQRIVGKNGDYGIGVYLDSDVLTELSEDERIATVKNHIKSLGGHDFVAYDNGKPVRIRIAKYSEKYVNKNGADIRVNNDLISYLKNKVKQEAIVLLDELTVTATYDLSEKAKHPHGWLDDYGKNDWDYWRVFIQEKNKTVWEATLNIANSKNGEKILYDIYPIKMVEGAGTSATTTTDISVSENEPGVKGKKSVAGTRVYNPSVSDADTSLYTREASSSLTARLLEENARLRDNIEDLYVQMNQSEGKLNTRAVNDVAKSLKEKYGSKISIPTLRRELAKLYTYMSGKNVDGAVALKRISSIAKDVIDRATETIEGGEYSELLKTIKETRIQVPESDKESFSEGYENFRKHSMGKLKLVKEGYPLDALWSDLVSDYPWLFSEELVGSEERLVKILEVREEMRPSEESIYKTEAEYDNAVTELENAIMGSFFEIPEGKGGNYTFFEAKYTDRFSREKLKKRIDSDFTYLHGMLKDPTDKRHIPEHLRAEVAAVLDCIKFETRQLDRLRDEGKEAQSPTAIKLAGISGLYEDIIRKAWGVEKNGESKLLDEYLSEDLLELKESIPADESGNFKRLQDMSTEELRVIGDVLRGIHHAVTKSNQAFTEGIKTTIDEASDNVVAELATTRSGRKGSGQKLEYGKEKGIGKAIGAIDKFMNVDMIQPWDMFHKIGGTLENIFGENRKAFDRHIVNLRKASDAIKAAIGDLKVKKMTGKGVEIKKFKLSDGSEVSIDKGQLLSLYALYKRPQGKEHLLSGGIITGRKATDGSGNKVSGNEIHRVSETDLGEMFETLSEKEKKMVEDIVRFMSKECARWGNEASMKLYGYEKYGEGWYFPIKVADTTLQMWSGGENEGNLRTQSFTKRLVKHAGNAVVIGDFFDTVTGHINGMSLYNTIALPMLDMERVLNHKTEGETVRQAIDITYGKAVNRYINKWLEDVNGSKKITDDGGLTEKFFKNAKKASIGMNLRVLFQQPTSITRALLFMNSVDLLAAKKALAHPAKTIKEMQKNVPIAYWKSLGFRDVGVGSSMKDAIIGSEPIYDKVAMGGYGLADDVTWALIYTAVKNEVQRKNPGIDINSEEFRSQVVERFNYIVDRSQVVDSVFHRSQIMRNERDFVKSATMFMSEPIKQLNMYRTELEDAVKSKSGKTIAKKVTRATAVYAFSNLILALAQALPDAWREDDEKELYDENGKKLSYWDIYKKKLGKDYLDDVNPLNGIPYVKDLISIVQGYSMDRVEYSALVRTINAVKALSNDKIPLPTRMWNVFKNCAPIFGVAPGNLARDLEGITKSIMRGFGDEYIDYTLTKINWDVRNPSNKSKFMKHYERAIGNGHAEDAQLILGDYLQSVFKEKNFENKNSREVLEKVTELYGKTESDGKLVFGIPESSFSFDGKEVNISENKYDEYVEGYYDILWKTAYEFVKSEEYNKLSDEDKVRSFGEIKTYAANAQRMESVDGYEIEGWQNKVYTGEVEFIDSVLERKENREYKESRENYKDNFDYDASKYSSAEIKTIEDVGSDAASYYTAIEMGREYNESDLRHIQVYDDYISGEMELEEYAGVRAYAKKTAATKGEGSPNSMSLDELHTYLESTDYSQGMKAALFEAIGNKGWKNPYSGGKIGDGVHFPKVEK